jgi:hypothetical protein
MKSRRLSQPARVTPTSSGPDSRLPTLPLLPCASDTLSNPPTLASAQLSSNRAGRGGAGLSWAGRDEETLAPQVVRAGSGDDTEVPLPASRTPQTHPYLAFRPTPTTTTTETTTTTTTNTILCNGARRPVPPSRAVLPTRPHRPRTSVESREASGGLGWSRQNRNRPHPSPSLSPVPTAKASESQS